MLETAAAVAAEWLGKVLQDEVNLLTGLEDKVESLRVQLAWMEALLLDAESSGCQSYVSRLYVSQIEELAKESQNVIKSYLAKVKPEDDGSGKNWTDKMSLKLFRSIPPRHEVGSKIDDLRKKMANLALNLKIFKADLILDRPTNVGGEGLKKGTQAEEAVGGGQKAEAKIPEGVGLEQLVDDLVKLQQLQQISELKDVHSIFGREKEVNKLSQKLVNNDKRERVVGVCGIRGSGKTALAQLIFLDEKIKKHFAKRCWVHASGDLEFRHFLSTLYRSVVGEQSERDINGNTEEELVSKLNSILRDDCCFMVLDDVRDARLLDSVISFFFQNTKEGSKILLTTRDTELAVDLNLKIHEIDKLDDGSSMSLLTKKLGREIDAEGDKQVYGMWQECKGNPLAVVALGMACESKALEQRECDMIRMLAYPERSLEHALGVAYHMLRDPLKPCILHLCSFPPNYKIPVALAFRIWIAAGFVSSSNGASTSEKCSEDIAMDLLNKMVEQSFVQVHHTSEGPTPRIESITVDVRARNCFLSKANEEAFLVVNQPQSDVYESYRYSMAAIHLDELELLYLDAFTKRHECPEQLNSFFTYSMNVKTNCKFEDKFQEWIERFCKKFTGLRILHLQSLPIGGLETQIANLVFLRYLSLKGTSITDIPSSVGNLTCLQLLDLRVRFTGKVVKVPNTLWKATRLIYLFLPAVKYVITEKNVLRLDTLSCLETLKNADVSKCKINDLPNLKKIRRLTLKLGTNDNLKVILSRFVSSDINVPRLSVCVQGAVIGQSGKLLPNALHRLEVEGRIPESLREVMFPTNLKVLKLESSKLEEDPMSILMWLPKLRTLALGKDSFLGAVMICYADGFAQLKKLKLASLPNFQKWTIEEGALSNLEELVIEKCDRFRTRPRYLPSSVTIIGQVLRESQEGETDNSSNYTVGGEASGSTGRFQCLQMCSRKRGLDTRP